MVSETAPKVRAEFKRHLRAGRSAYGAVSGIAEHQRYAMAGVVAPIKGSPAPKKFKGAIPAALWFAASAESPRLYVEKLESGRYWLLATMGLALDPRTDGVLSREDLVPLVLEISREAQRSGQDLAISVWPSIAEMPEEIAAMSRVSPAPIESCLTQSAKPKLRVAKHVGIPSWVGTATLALAVVGASGYGLMLAHQELQNQMQAREQAARERAAAEQARLAEMAQAAARPDEAALAAGSLAAALGTPSPPALIAGCLEVAADLPATAGGWRLSALECVPGRPASATYEQDHQRAGLATQESFAAAMSAHELPFSYEWFGRTAIVEAGLIELELRPAPELEALPSVDAAGTWWASHASRTQALIRGARITVASQPTVAVAAPDQPPLPFASRSVQFAGSAAWQMHDVIPDAANLALHSITLKPQLRGAWSWTAAGALYHSQEPI